jgi:hypothetical protein
MSVYVGIDVHRKRARVAVVDQDGKVLAGSPAGQRSGACWWIATKRVIAGTPFDQARYGVLPSMLVPRSVTFASFGSPKAAHRGSGKACVPR